LFFFNRRQHGADSRPFAVKTKKIAIAHEQSDLKNMVSNFDYSKILTAIQNAGEMK